MSEAGKIVDSLVSSAEFRDFMRTIVAEVVNDTLVKGILRDVKAKSFSLYRLLNCR